MREVSSVFEKGFSVGLKPQEHLTTQGEYLEQCYNLLPTNTGLEPRKEVWEPSCDLDFGSRPWPWPALYCLSRFNLLFSDDGLWVAPEGSWDFQFVMQPVDGWGGLPHVADFMDFIVFATPKGEWALLNGEIVRELRWAKFKTCCAYRGQLIIGDCQLPNGPELNNCQESAQAKVPVGGPQVVAWSDIGKVDWGYFAGPESGWAPMSWQGNVFAVLPLGKEVVVYGSDGIAKLAAFEQPIPTFGVQDFGDIGVLNRDCVAGDTGKHLYVGKDFNLYLIQPERALSSEGKEPLRLGYAHLIRELVNPIVTFDPAYGHWWICGENRAFIYNGVGLGEASISPSHLSRVEDNLISYQVVHGEEMAVVETGTLSFNSRGIKALMNVEADVESEEKVFGQCSWKSNLRDKFRLGQKILLDPRGAFFPVLSGVVFRIKLEANKFQAFRLAKLWMHFKNTDKTFSRGIINAGHPEE